MAYGYVTNGLQEKYLKCIENVSGDVMREKYPKCIIGTDFIGSMVAAYRRLDDIVVDSVENE